MTADGARMLEEVSAMTECSICIDDFTDPRTLPCIHTFCWKCIEGTAKNKQPGAKFPCPLCREEFIIPKEGFIGFRKNFFMTRLVEVNKMLKAPSDARLCDACLEDAEENRHKPPVAQSYCAECRQNLCDECCKHHRKNKILKTHRVVVLGSQTDVKEFVKIFQSPLCDTHPTKPLELFCRDCNSVICILCFVESHNFHKCCDLNVLVPEFRKQLQKDSQTVSNLTAEACIASELAKKAKSDIQAQFRKTTIAINRRTEKLRQLIDEHSRSLSNELKHLKSSKLNELNATIENMDHHSTILESFKTYSLSMAENGSDSDICQSASELSRRTYELQKTHEARILPQIQPNSQQNVFQETDLDSFLTPSSKNIIGTLRDLPVFITPRTLTSSAASTPGLKITTEANPATTSQTEMPRKRKHPEDDDDLSAGGKTNCYPLKKPLSAFFLFSQEQRPIVRATHPDLTMFDTARLLGEKWRGCTNQAKYKAKAAEERKRYDEKVLEQFLQGN